MCSTTLALMCSAWAVFLLTASATVPFSSPFSAASLEKGKEEYERILQLSRGDSQGQDSSSCWELSLSLFSQLDESCEVMREQTKKLLALSLTKCHFAVRPRGFPSADVGCDLPTVTAPICGTTLEGLDEGSLVTRLAECDGRRQAAVDVCSRQMSDSAFESFLGFFNHIDNICFYLQSTIWQQKTDSMVSHLSCAAIRTRHFHLRDEASLQHESLLNQQRVALVQQQDLMSGSERLQAALSQGQAGLEKALGDMRHEVQHEQEKIQTAFDEVFNLFYRILDLQRRVSSQLADFGTVITYVCLVILTHYMTTPACTRRIRATLYAIWFVMLLGEHLLSRLFVHCEDSGFVQWLSATEKDGLKECSLLTWRYLWLAFAFARWVSAWWCFVDPTDSLAALMTSGFANVSNEIQKHVQTQLTQERQASVPPYALCYDDDSEEEDFVPSSDEEDEDEEELCEKVAVRRNPDRQTRPKSFAPSSQEKVNPLLFRESPEMFVQQMTINRLCTRIQQMQLGFGHPSVHSDVLNQKESPVQAHLGPKYELTVEV